MSGEQDREAEIRARLDAATQARRECDPEKHGGPGANYSPVFIANAFAKHAPGDESDAELREIWWADAEVMHHAPDDLRWLLTEVERLREVADLTLAHADMVRSVNAALMERAEQAEANALRDDA